MRTALNTAAGTAYMLTVCSDVPSEAFAAINYSCAATPETMTSSLTLVGAASASANATIALNLTGALHMHHAVLPGMVERRAGRVVNVASDAARVGSSGEAVYAACKGGLVALSKTLAREHARHGITVNVVAVGHGVEPSYPGLNGAEPAVAAEIARMALFLTTPAARHINGQTLHVSAGAMAHFG